ncbi:hypothetical protein [Pseudomonas typographi]|uniref:Uncharacterized protein n=1 Tax=Pseudomonas typographi TaxID=2715964 RepID=A0ABR7Z9M6_9PSED|nr:hypothetical protein [Pseudomonas typographi]MBD1555059.1 hypothetical protein [Pseudomonas typographi]MBD1590096.1 hypothetical protein [Pseudomonas typographi]MBD1602159.1 hypothetical protein [Pseudomonas typographi]
MDKVNLQEFLEAEIKRANAVTKEGDRKAMAQGRLSVLEAILRVVDKGTRPNAPQDLGVAEAINDLLQAIRLIKPHQTFWRLGPEASGQAEASK